MSERALARVETSEGRRAHRAVFFHGACFKCTGLIEDAAGGASFVEVLDARGGRVRYHTACAPVTRLAVAADESVGLPRYSMNRVVPGYAFVDGPEDFITAAEAWCVLMCCRSAHCC